MIKQVLPVALAALLLALCHVSADDSTDSGIDDLLSVNNIVITKIVKEMNSETDGNVIMSTMSPLFALLYVTVGTSNTDLINSWLELIGQTDLSQAIESFMKYEEIINDYSGNTVDGVLYIDEDYTFYDAFINLLVSLNKSEGYVDYSNSNSAASTMNTRALEKLPDQVDSTVMAIDSSGIPEDKTIPILISTVNWKSNWLCTPETVDSLSFTSQDGTTTDVDGIYMSGEFGYLETDTAQIYRVNMEESDYNIYINVPKDSSDEGIAEQLELYSNITNCNVVVESMQSTDMTITIPTFSVQKSYNVTKYFWKVFADKIDLAYQKSYDQIAQDAILSTLWVQSEDVVKLDETTSSDGSDTRCLSSSSTDTTVIINKTHILFFAYKSAILGAGVRKQA